VYLADAGVGTLIQWGGRAVHEFKDLGFTQSLPFTESIMRNGLLLPINMSITDKEVEYVCKAITEFYD
jgi:dTDP-4-amino-4,6-dideoxygalactose transaminase